MSSKKVEDLTAGDSLRECVFALESIIALTDMPVAAKRELQVYVDRARYVLDILNKEQS